MGGHGKAPPTPPPPPAPPPRPGPPHARKRPGGAGPLLDLAVASPGPPNGPPCPPYPPTLGSAPAEPGRSSISRWRPRGHEMALHTPSVRRAPAKPWRSSGLCRQSEPLPRQQLPGAVLLLPYLKGADLGGRLLALELGFGQVDVARDSGIADHGHLELRKGQRLDGLLAGHHPVDELLLGLDPPVGMAVADLSG